MTKPPKQEEAPEAAEAEKEVEAAPLSEEELKLIESRIEAVLFTITKPITPGKLADTLGLEGAKQASDAIKRLNAFYDEHQRAFRIEKLAGGFQVMSLPEFKDDLASMHRTRAQSKLSNASMETLAIIAYKQPIMRADIEAIRGVASGEVCRTLMDVNLIKIVGRAEEVGRPMLYGTTKTFLEVFGLSSLKDMPKVEEFIKQ